MTTYGSVELKEEGFDRLPKGEAVPIPLAPGAPVPLVLANHKFHMVVEDGLYLVDESGLRQPLHPGRNIVGRDLQCDVVLGASLKDVSRKHLLVETQGEALVHLTDISSLGTFVPCEYLEEKPVRARA